jgi:hypothetical protein
MLRTTLHRLRFALPGAGAVALVLVAVGGAANGGNFILGQANTATATTLLSGSTAAPQLKVMNANTSNHTILAQAAGGDGIAVYGQHTSSAGAGPALRGDSASTAAGALSIYGLLSSSAPGSNSAAIRAESKSASANGYGLWASQAGTGIAVYATTPSGIGVRGQSANGTGVFGVHSASSGSAPGVRGDNNSTAPSNGVEGHAVSPGGSGVFGINTGGGSGVAGSGGRGVYGTGGFYGVYGTGSGYGVYGQGPSFGVAGQGPTGVYGQSSTGVGVSGLSSGGAGAIGVSGASDNAGAFGVKGESLYGTGVRGESFNFQGVSGSSVHNAGVYGETTGNGFAAYFVGPTEQHGALNVYDHTASVANGNVRIARDTASFSGTGAALQAEHAGTNGEAAWFRISNASNTNAVLRLVRPTGTGDFLNCYQQGANAGQVCHIDKNGTFMAGSDFAESLPARGGKARYQAGDVLSISRTKAGQVLKSHRPFDPALIGVYSTRPAVLGADKGGITRVGTQDIPVAITGIVPVKVTAQNGQIRPGDLLTSSGIPGRAMNAGRNPAVGTVLGKALGFLSRGQGTIKMLVMPR